MRLTGVSDGRQWPGVVHSSEGQVIQRVTFIKVTLVPTYNSWVMGNVLAL